LFTVHGSALGRFPPIGTYPSQFGQDKWVIEEVFHFKKSGFFVDIGANNGLELSNTYVLEKFLKWKGICIEANPSHYQSLHDKRGDSINLNVCLDETNHVVEFRCDNNLFAGIVDADTDNRTANTPQQLAELEKNGKIIRMLTKTLEQVLEECNAPHIIDFLSIDVEGAETRILRNFPFGTYTFLAIAIERPSPELRQILQKNGYVLVGHNPCDEYYVHRSIENFSEIYNKAQ
jgi:FkbM family methyltransferase